MESISRLSNILDAARELTIEAARDASGQIQLRRSAAAPNQSARIETLLQSKSESEVVEGLREVVRLLYTSPDKAITYFSDVLKTISSPSAEVRKLVGLVLVQLSPRHPDTALLAINTLQKSLTESSPTLRALALKTMSSIRVPAIAQIVLLAIKRGAGDPSPLVRRTAAFAIPKALLLSASTLKEPLAEILDYLLDDDAHFVTGAAVQALASLWPGEDKLIHPHFQHLVHQMIDMDEWAQLALLRLLLPYCRRCFPQEENFESRDPDLETFLRGCVSLLSSRNSGVIVAASRTLLYLGDDSILKLAIGQLLALMRAPSTEILPVALHALCQICTLRPALFAVHAPRFLVKAGDSARVGSLKIEILSTLFLSANEQHRSLVLTELERLCQSVSPNPSERDIVLAQAAVRGLGACARVVSESNPELRQSCLWILLDQITRPQTRREPAPGVMAELLSTIRALVATSNRDLELAVALLTKNLDVITDPGSRATVLWLAGELAMHAPENPLPLQVLRAFMIDRKTNYAEEGERARLQVSLLAAKVYLQYLVGCVNSSSSGSEGLEDGQPETRGGTVTIDPQHAAVLFYQHSLVLAKYDSSYDVRDRSRVYQALLPNPESLLSSESTLDLSVTQLAQLVLAPAKKVPNLNRTIEGRRGLIIGTTTNLLAEGLGCLGMGEEDTPGGFDSGANDDNDDLGVGNNYQSRHVRALLGFDTLPPWVKAGHEPDKRLRRQATEPGSRTNRPNRVGAEGLKTGFSSAEYARAKKMTQSGGMSNRDVGIGTWMGARPGPESGFLKDGGGRRSGPVQVKSLDDWLAEDDQGVGAGAGSASSGSRAAGNTVVRTTGSGTGRGGPRADGDESDDDDENDDVEDEDDESEDEDEDESDESYEEDSEEAAEYETGEEDEDDEDEDDGDSDSGSDGEEEEKSGDEDGGQDAGEKQRLMTGQ